MVSKKILVVLTGGTIGSVCNDGVRDIAGDSPYLLLRTFRRLYPQYADCEFEVVNPFHILSENLTPNHWTILYHTVSQADPAAYRGIVVTHGSDTLAYTAAALGLLLRHTAVPVVLTAADRPVPDPKSNALPNFRAAVDFIRNGGRKGVFVSYRRYDTGAQAIYLATRLVSADNCRDEFSSYGGAPLGVMQDGTFVPDNTTGTPSAETLNRQNSPIIKGNLTLTQKIMLLRSYPGMDYTAVNPDGFAAVVNYGYHSATACVEGENTSLLHFAERCRKCGAALWLGSFKGGDDNELYGTSRALLDSGILPFYDMSPEAAYAKAVLAYNLPDTNAEEFMRRCVYFEMVGHDVNFQSEVQPHE